MKTAAIQALHEEIASYAAQTAGSVEDLDIQLEKAGLEHIDLANLPPNHDT